MNLIERFGSENMATSLVSNHRFPLLPNPPRVSSQLLRSKEAHFKKSAVIRCCAEYNAQRERRKKNYYELLGVSPDSNPQRIKEAYRKLQKIHHPDISGQKGHEYTLLLNEAYMVLMREDLKKDYDASIGHTRVGLGNNVSGSGYSSWNGPVRPQALFVDESACIGCRECVHHASNTFEMDETRGSARVKVQFGDDDKSIKVSVDSCPVNCIHYVEREDLAVLEFLSRPQLKEGYGIFGQGWERPANVFMAAKSFDKTLKRQAESKQRNVRRDVEQETQAQAQARESASLKLKMGRFSRIWNWVKGISGQ